MKTIIVMFGCVFATLDTFAFTETIDGVTWTYSVVDGEADITGATLSQSSSITVPTEINGYTVTKILSNAFYGNTLLRGVTIPGSVRSVCEKAFYKCSNLASVVFLEGVQSIGYCGFQYCGSLKTITIPASLTTIAAMAFNACPAIERVNVDSVESYMNIEFGSGSSTPLYSGIACLYTNGVKIVDLVIPSGTMQIKACAFNGQGMLQSLTIPGSVMNIGPYAFDNFQPLTRVIFDSDIGTVYVDYQGQNGQNVQAEVAPKYGYVFKGWVDDNGSKVVNPFRVSEAITISPLWQRSAPIISPEGATFPNTSQEVCIDCEAYDATIYYTVDGGDPLEEGLEYKKPFAIYKSCMVRAVAVDDNGNNSVEATATFTRSESLSEAVNLYGYTMETDDVVPWVVDGEVSRDGVSSVRSGAIGNNGTTWLQTSIKKAGRVSFWWRAACEEADEEEGEDGYYDYGAFLVDDVVVARIAGHDGEWHYVSHEVTSGGKHTLRWEYRKDGATSYAPDCVWLDQVQWTPADGSGFTMTSPEQVPYSWLSTYGFGGRDADFETAANAPSGKRDGAGRATSVWQEYVAGTDPTNETSRFSAKIELRDGVPVVTWEPDLNENGVKSERLYKVYGRESLGDDSPWQYPTNSLHRFFKVTVEMP